MHLRGVNLSSFYATSKMARLEEAEIDMFPKPKKVKKQNKKRLAD